MVGLGVLRKHLTGTKRLAARAVMEAETWVWEDRQSGAVSVVMQALNLPVRLRFDPHSWS